MTRRVFTAALILTAAPAPAFGSILLPFDAQRNTWASTHIVLVEGGKVVESWTGDLKAGDPLPAEAERFTQIPVPGPDSWPRPAGEKAPRVSGTRMVLFLAFVAREGGDPKKRVWTGAGFAPTSSVAWVEDDSVFSAYQPKNPGGYALTESGGLAGLKQQVDLGLALRKQVEAAIAEKDPGRRAERLVVLTPFVSKYAGYVGLSECVWEVSKCGKPAIPHLARWASDPRGEGWSESLYALGRFGDDGLDAVVKVLDREAAYWEVAASELKPGETIYDWTRSRPAGRSPNHLYHVLQATRGMKLSAGNKERLQKHPGLRKLDDLMATNPALTPKKSDMEAAHTILRDILAGKFRPDE